MDNKDINVKIENTNFSVRAAVLIKRNNKILIQKRIKDKIWALPGGKIQINEKIEDAIRREMKEELNVELNDLVFLSICENLFSINSEKVHQYIFTYSAKINDDIYDIEDEFKSIEYEKDVIYKWVDINDFQKFDIRPDNIKELLENLNTGNVLFYSNSEL